MSVVKAITRVDRGRYVAAEQINVGDTILVPLEDFVDMVAPKARLASAADFKIETRPGPVDRLIETLAPLGFAIFVLLVLAGSFGVVVGIYEQTLQEIQRQLAEEMKS